MASLPKPAEVNVEDENANCILLDDVVRKIVENLPLAEWPQLELVSKQFQRCVQNAYYALKTLDLKTVFLPEFGKNLKLENENAFNQFFTKLIPRCPLIQAISGLDTILYEILSAHWNLLSEFTELNNISFDNMTLDINDLAHFLKKYSRMKSLKFHNSFPRKIFDRKINDAHFDFFENFYGLAELQIAGLTDCSGSFLSMVNAENLKVLHFCWPSFEGIYVTALLKRAVNLETLHLYDDDLHTNFVGLELQVLQCLPNLTKLREFHLQISKFIGLYGRLVLTADDLVNILVRCRNLRGILLVTGHVEIVNDNFLHRLIAECPLLEALEFNTKHCQSEEMVSNVVYLQHLKRLSMRSKKPGILRGLFSKLHKLDTLSDLTIVGPVEEAELVLLKNVKNLVCLSCKGAVTETVAKNWIEAGFLKKLTYLDVNYVFTKSVFENAPNLKEIRLRDYEVNDDTLDVIADCCKYLQVLHLICPVTEKGLFNFLSNCRSLRRVEVKYVTFCGPISSSPLLQPFKHVVRCQYTSESDYSQECDLADWDEVKHQFDW